MVAPVPAQLVLGPVRGHLGLGVVLAGALAQLAVLVGAPCVHHAGVVQRHGVEVARVYLREHMVFKDHGGLVAVNAGDIVVKLRHAARHVVHLRNIRVVVPPVVAQP